MAKNRDATSDKDTGWGLIFRLNDLWAKADRVSLAARYDLWELVLDRIFSNLLYREDPEVIRNEDGNIIDVSISEDDLSEWKIMKSKIRKAKTNKKLAIQKRNLNLIAKYNEEYYQSIFFYDIWMRKFMQRHGLYLKETESNPSKSLFGGAFR